MGEISRSTFDKLDDEIRSGRASAVQKELRRLCRRKIARKDMLPLAALARRAGVPDLALRVLGGVVRPPHRRVAEASPAEKAEYAASLVRVGATTEALGILDGLSAADLPEALMFRAYAYIGQWQYAEAIGVLQQYLARASLTDYQRLIAQANLVSALVFERRHEETWAVLPSLLEETSRRKLTLLHGAALELSAQSRLFQRRWKEAEAFLRKSEKALQGGGSLEELFVRKWQTILKLMRYGANAKTLAALDAIDAEARQRRHWETCRTLDRFRALCLNDVRLARRLYFGTPFESFRRRLCDDIGIDFGAEPSFAWQLAGRGHGPMLDLIRGELHLKSKVLSLKPGQQLHRLLSVLASDFYRPLRVAPIHLLLFPEEHYNPFSSPARVHEAVMRLRQWAKRLPLNVEAGEGYWLSATSSFRIVVGQDFEADEIRVTLQRLDKHNLRGAFTTKEIATALGLTTRSARLWVTKALAQGRIVAVGNGKRTEYCRADCALASPASRSVKG